MKSGDDRNEIEDLIDLSKGIEEIYEDEKSDSIYESEMGSEDEAVAKLVKRRIHLDELDFLEDSKPGR